MQLSVRGFSALVADMAAAAQGSCATLLDVSVGSVLRAILESSSSAALWLQFLILQVQSMTRLATSVAGDVDSWVADYGLTRLPATAATGSVVLTSFNPSSQASTVNAGITVKTTGAGQVFTVTGGPYTRAIGTASITVSIAASVAGTAGNVVAGAITVLGSAVPGIDTVTNLQPTAGGAQAETDNALRARFVVFFNSRSQATNQAIENAILSVQQGLSYVIEENVTASGLPSPGCFTVIVDDGSGAPPASLLNAVYEAVSLVRPIGSVFSVIAPTLITVSVTVSGDNANPALVTNTISAVSSAISTYVNGLKVGQILRFSRLAGLAYDASSDVVNVAAVFLNGGTSDVGGTAASVVRCNSVSVSMGA